MNTRQHPSIEARTLALAGIFQAGALVADIARERPLNEPALRSTLSSLFVSTPESAEDVFGGISGARLGLLLVRDSLTQEWRQPHREVLHYALSVMQTERRFAQCPDLQKILHERLERVTQQRKYFDLLHPTIVSALAAIYQDTLSTLPQRIQVAGSTSSLQETRNIDRIRAVLLGGVRSALLWHQIGGRLWRLLLNQSAIRQAANRLVQQLS